MLFSLTCRRLAILQVHLVDETFASVATATISSRQTFQ